MYDRSRYLTHLSAQVFSAGELGADWAIYFAQSRRTFLKNVSGFFASAALPSLPGMPSAVFQPPEQQISSAMALISKFIEATSECDSAFNVRYSNGSHTMKEMAEDL